MAGDAKIRIKVGSLELDYEGDPAFLSDGLEELLEKMAALSGQVPAKGIQDNDSEEKVEGASSNDMNYSTDTIASYLGGKKASELAISALAQLTIIQRKATSTRNEILDEMKAATDYYTETMRSNLTATLKRLTASKRINKNATNSYSLSADEKKSIEAKIAEIG